MGIAADPQIEAPTAIAVERTDGPSPLGLRRVEDVDSRAPDGGVERAGSSEDRIADRIGVESAEGGVREELIERVDLTGPRRGTCRPTESPAGHHLPQGLLH